MSWEQSWPVKEESWDDTETYDECNGWYGDQAKHELQEDSQVSGGWHQSHDKEATEKSTEGAHMDAVKPTVEGHLAAKSNKRQISETSDQVGMSFENLAPREAVHIFLCRYHGRDVAKCQDYSYTCKEVNGGYVAKLSVPTWFDLEFYGEKCETMKKAEQSAAKAFTEDVDVLATAAKLPPPVWALTSQVKAKSVRNKPFMQGRQLQKFEHFCRQKAHDQYNSYRDSGSRTAMWDGNA